MLPAAVKRELRSLRRSSSTYSEDAVMVGILIAPLHGSRIFLWKRMVLQVLSPDIKTLSTPISAARS